MELNSMDLIGVTELNRMKKSAMELNGGMEWNNMAWSGLEWNWLVK